MHLENVSILCFAASYALALALAVGHLLRPARVLRVSQQVAMAAGLVAQSAYLTWHTLPVPHGPRALLLLSLILAIFAFSGSFHYRRQAWGVFILPVVLLLIIMAWRQPGTLADYLVPEETVRLTVVAHLVFILLGAVGLCIAFVASIMYLVHAGRLRRKQLGGGVRLLSLERLETMNRRAVGMAFPLLTSGLVTGVLLMRQTHLLTWWDAKVVTTALLWVVLAVLVYLRYGLHLQGRRVAWWTVLAFALMLLAFAVPWLLPSAHPTAGGAAL
jgi:ABC-type uncharacterized transport system permease subunit